MKSILPLSRASSAGPDHSEGSRLAMDSPISPRIPLFSASSQTYECPARNMMLSAYGAMSGTGFLLIVRASLLSLGCSLHVPFLSIPRRIRSDVEHLVRDHRARRRVVQIELGELIGHVVHDLAQGIRAVLRAHCTEEPIDE